MLLQMKVSRLTLRSSSDCRAHFAKSGVGAKFSSSSNAAKGPTSFDGGAGCCEMG